MFKKNPWDRSVLGRIGLLKRGVVQCHLQKTRYAAVADGSAGSIRGNRVTPHLLGFQEDLVELGTSQPNDGGEDHVGPEGGAELGRCRAQEGNRILGVGNDIAHDWPAIMDAGELARLSASLSCGSDCQTREQENGDEERQRGRGCVDRISIPRQSV